MQQEHPTLGKLLLHGKASVARLVRRVILFMIPAMGLAIVGIIGLIDPYLMAMEDELWVAPVVLGAAALYVILMVFFVKPYEVAVYENGFAWKRRGNKINELRHDEFLTNDIIQTTTYGFIPVSKARNFSIAGVSGTNIDLRKVNLNFTRTNTANFHAFADLLREQQVNYVAQKLTAETVFNTTMVFASDLILENGKFIHRKGHKKEKFAFLKDVKTADVFWPGNGNCTIQLSGPRNEFGKAETLLEYTGSSESVYNTDFVQVVVEIANTTA